ncbi:MAG: hypothetical protein E6776_13295, partial [Eggerthella sp.]|nr:hypothetical protein [Eggerthella sp.]
VSIMMLLAVSFSVRLPAYPILLCRGCYFPVAPHLSRPMSDPVHPMVPPVAKKARIRKFRSVPQALRKTLFLVIPGHRSALHGYRHAVPS